MCVADVMSHKPVTIAPDIPVSEAFRVASAYGGQHWVLTEGRTAVGVVCVRSLRAGFHAGKDEGLFFCAACGTHMHVHPVPGSEWIAFCVDCWDRAGPPRVGEDLGESD
jgi:hypothetical protein